MFSGNQIHYLVATKLDLISLLILEFIHDPIETFSSPSAANIKLYVYWLNKVILIYLVYLAQGVASDLLIQSLTA